MLTSYLVANAVILPASNWFSLRFGRKRFLITCVIIFTVASFFCGAAPTLGFMLIARVIQGAGGGALQPLSQSILLESFPPEKRRWPWRFWFGVVVAPVLGPTLGGWLTDTYSWRYAFYINIPVGALAVFMISRFIQDPEYITKGKWASSTIWVSGCWRYGPAACRWCSTRGRRTTGLARPGSAGRWHPGGLAVLVDLALVDEARRAGEAEDAEGPELPAGVRSDCDVRALHLLMITVLPLYYQELLGYTAFTAGLVVGPRGIGSISDAGHRILGSRIDHRKLLCAGFLGFGACALYFGMVNLGIGPYTLLIPITLTGFALSFVFVPLATMTTARFPRRNGQREGLFNMLRNIGGSIGIAMATTAMIRRAELHQTYLGGT